VTDPTALPAPTYQPPPATPLARFVGLAWSSLILGIVGIVSSLVLITKSVAMLAAIVGVVLGSIALFGSRKALAGIGVALCALAVTLAVLIPSTLVTNVGKPLIGDDTMYANGKAYTRDPAAIGTATVSGCEVVSGYGFIGTDGTVRATNTTSEPQSYIVTGNVNDSSGTRVAQAHAFIDSLAAGQSSTSSLARGAMAQDAKPGKATCVVAAVHRSEG
jgi:hypothetical protein